jgi:hypothetical protein
VRSAPLLAALSLAACGRLGFEAFEASPDAAIDGAGHDVAPTACTRLFCDDLEDPSFAAWSGSTLDGTATAAHDATFGRSGGSLKAVSPLGTDEADRWVDVFPATQVLDQWVRVMLFVPSGQTLDLEPVSMMDAGRTQEFVMSVYDTDIDIHAHGIAADFNETRAMATPRDRWACFELHVQFSGSGVVELYLDGALLLQRAIATEPTPGTALRRVAVGITSKPTTFSHTVWVDDVVADTARIGCP